MAYFRILLLILPLCGCATPEYSAPVVNSVISDAQRTELQRDAVAFQLERRGRLYDLAWPLLIANTELCPKTKKSIGVVLADLDAYTDFVGGLRTDQLASLGVEDDMHILHVMAGSPADEAGLTRGVFVRAVNGKEFADSKPSKIAKAISKAVEDGAPVKLRIRENATDREVQIAAVEVCDVAVKLSKSSALNAMARDKTIVFNAGLMRAIDDDVVQHVLAHELAHVALRHPRKIGRNVVVSGGVFYVPVLYAGGSLADRALRLFNIKRKGSLALRGVSTGVPYGKDFEAEADYVGLYMLARAGGNLDVAGDIFYLFANESPSTTWLRYTHPMTPERVAAAELTVTEIRAKQKAGVQILPEQRN